MIKPSYNTNRSLLGKCIPLDMPFSIVVDLSEQCNFKCNYCFRSGIKNDNWSYASLNDLMSFETFEKVLEQLKMFPHKIKSISLSGHGEPLCNPLLEEMANSIKIAGITEQIDIHTNASLLTEERAVKLAKSGLTRIIVSLQGLCAEDYNKVAGVKINWDKFYENLRILYKNKNDELKIHIKISEAAFPENEFDNYYNRFVKLFEPIADTIFVEKVVPLWQNVNCNNEIANKFGSSFGKINYCPLLFYKIVVIPSGEIFPCTNLPPLSSLGNINKISLFEAWKSSERKEMLIDHLLDTNKENKICANCFVPTNTVLTENDMIDPYKDEILRRLLTNEL